MARQPVHLVAASKRPVSRDAMWAAIRHFGKFTVPQLAGETNIHRDTIKTYVDGLEAAGYLERVGREGGQGGTFRVRPGARFRSEERRVGKECVSTCRSRWSPAHSKKKTRPNTTG